MEGWTTQRALQLAPDPASAKAGQDLATLRKWVLSGFDPQAVWGECQGSGSKPYQTQIDLSEPAFKCSCPSRKFPCKHGLALLILFASDQLKAAARPAWVEQWLASRLERTQKKLEKAEAPPKPVDEAAQARRREKRLQRVSEGLASLKLWAQDLVRGGVATAPSRGYAFFDEPARRMIDAQAPGVARRLQLLAATAAGGAGWQRPFVAELASLYLLIQAWERIDQLPELIREDIFAALGLPQSQDDVLALPSTKDCWQIIAQETTIEERLRVQRTWLFGEETKRPALVLAFAHGNAAFETTLPAGFSFHGELCFYPGNATRAVVKSRQDLMPLLSVKGVETLDALCETVSGFRARQPWADSLAIPLLGVVPVRKEEGWILVDRHRQWLPMTVADMSGWTMLAISGGDPIDVVAAFDNRLLRPLAVVRDAQYTSLITNDLGAVA